ncbi:hypothetical protein [Parendozoicomonas sp. Alg238-R29]|nr:hypothetical protein [Parendozoicomonas sp. Alg238-R29]
MKALGNAELDNKTTTDPRVMRIRKLSFLSGFTEKPPIDAIAQ